MKTFAGIIVSLLIFLCVGEALARILGTNFLNYDLEMTRYGLYVKSDSVNPLIGHVHQPGLRKHLMGVDVRTNSDGFRDHEYSIGRSQGRRVVFLGDSLTLGWGVEEDKTFKTLIERAWNQTSPRKEPVELLNFAAGNYNTEQEAHLFFEKGLKYFPDRAVVFYFINDAEMTPTRPKAWFLGYSYLFTYYWSGFRTLRGLLSHTQGYQAYYSSLYSESNPGWPREKLAFRDLKDFCQSRHIQLQVVLLPEFHQFNPYPFTREHRLVSDYLTSLGIDHLDLAPFFSQERHAERLWVNQDDAHPNALAHRLIAKYAGNYLIDLPFHSRNRPALTPPEIQAAE